jgi:enoyl-CoA hydratase/carnithine racemase
MNDRMSEGVSPPSRAVLQRNTDDGIVTLILDRPRQHNALSRALLEALHGELDAIALDSTVRVVIITGAGGTFCSGHDLKEMRALGSEDEVHGLFSLCSAMMLKLTALPQPVIAGDFIDAATALEWGLVNRVAAPGRLMEVAREIALKLKGKPRETLAIGKALFYRQLEQGISGAYADASSTIARDFSGEIAREGVDAFLAKVPPRWKP